MPEPGRPDGSRPELLVALFVAVTWAAAAFAVSGLLSVLLDRDLIHAPAGRFYGLASLALAGVVVWLVVGFSARAARAWPGALAAAAGVYLALVITAFPIGFPLVVEEATSPFVIAAAALGAVAVLGTWASFRSRARG